nr:MAG TPA: Major tail protein [Caudoviricetes sp.]
MTVFIKHNFYHQFHGSTPTSDVVFGNSDINFTIRQMRAKKEYLQQIDDYFSMFGYKINNLKIPNLSGRQNWNYVKTIDCNFDGDIPQTDLQIIRSSFDNGITLWHNSNTMYDYSQNNNII